MKEKACEERLRELGLSSPEKERLRGTSSQPATTYEEVLENTESVFSPPVHGRRTKHNGRKVKWEMFSQDLRTTFFPRSSAKCWNSSPRKAAQALSMGLCKPKQQEAATTTKPHMKCKE